MDLKERVLTAYGGESFWRNARKIRVLLSAWGWAFRLKCRPAMKQPTLLLAVHEPLTRITPIDAKGNTGILDGKDVRIETDSGQIVEERKDARRYFPYGRRAFRWDALDQTYFAGYAAWNYFAFPALLMRSDVVWKQTAENRLEAVFPQDFPTHSSTQQFHFDRETNLLKQHDYTAQVMGNWARAAHLVLEYGKVGNIPYGTRRRVYPRKSSGGPVRFPLLIGIDIHSYDIE